MKPANRIPNKFVDAQNPNSWSEYRKGICDDCQATCCELPVEVFASDLERLGLISAEEAKWPLDEVAQRLYDAKITEAFDSKRQRFVLAQTAGRYCLYLDLKTRRCTVYETRPDTCRNFPRIGPRPGFCPYKKR